MKMVRLLIVSLLFVSIDSNATALTATKHNLLSLRLTDFVRLTPQHLYKMTGYRMNFKEKIQLSVLKYSMKKAIRKNRNMTVEEFILSKKNPGVVGALALVIGAIILVVYVLFLVFYEP